MVYCTQLPQRSQHRLHHEKCRSPSRCPEAHIYTRATYGLIDIQHALICGPQARFDPPTELMP